MWKSALCYSLGKEIYSKYTPGPLEKLKAVVASNI